MKKKELEQEFKRIEEELERIVGILDMRREDAIKLMNDEEYSDDVVNFYINFVAQFNIKILLRKMRELK